MQLYVKLYPETLRSSGSVEAIVRAVWELVGGGKRTNVADDGVRPPFCHFVKLY